MNIEHPQQRLRIRKAISDASVQFDILMYEKQQQRQQEAEAEAEAEAAAATDTNIIINNNKVKVVVVDDDDDMIEEEEEEEEVEQVVCECCGLKEDCTRQYITEVKAGYSGKWVCGLCSEAVRDKLARSKARDMDEAVSLHSEFRKRYNDTTILNPKLSLACAMRDIAKRSWEYRRTTTTNNNNMPISKMTRTTSCFPKIDI